MATKKAAKKSLATKKSTSGSSGKTATKKATSGTTDNTSVKEASGGSASSKKTATKSTAAKKATKSSAESASTSSAKKATKKRAGFARELIAPNGDKRLIRRDERGRIQESDDLGRSLAQDVRKKSETVVKSGQGDRGDQKKRTKKATKTATKKAAKKSR